MASKRISFNYDHYKAAQAVLWLLSRHSGRLSKLQVVKLLFYADRLHLAVYGRPIIGGTYYAMKHGPVSSELLNHLNEAETNQEMPFSLKAHTLFAKEPADENALSDSDIEVLRRIDAKYGKHDRFVLRDMTHKLKAWQNNYPDPSANTSHPLPYEDFFTDLTDSDLDDSILEIIRENQEARAVFD